MNTMTHRLHSRVRDELNFVVTNRIPRAWLTRAFGRFSRIEHPIVAELSIRAWRAFGGLDLSDAREPRFKSVHDCFTRRLVDGARPSDPDPSVLASPCDAIVGECGAVREGTVFQAKGMPYTLDELFAGHPASERHRNGCWATLRLTAAMYHRFHSPHDLRVDEVTYVAGDAWNVNPPAVARVERLYCRNERALVHAELVDGGHRVTLVPVAAILVASIRLEFVDVRLHLRYRGPNRITCDARLGKGDEMGWFEHGSTILVFAPAGFKLADGIAAGSRVRAGQALMRLPGGGEVVRPGPG